MGANKTLAFDYTIDFYHLAYEPTATDLIDEYVTAEIHYVSLRTLVVKCFGGLLRFAPTSMTSRQSPFRDGASAAPDGRLMALLRRN